MLFKKLLISILFFSFSAFSQEKIEVFFDFDQFSLNESAVTKLNTWMLKNSNIEVLKIYGFCDWKGSNAYNDTLSVRRVKSVYTFLKENRIQINPNYQEKGFGENFEQSENQAENRKVIIVFGELKQPLKPIDEKSKPLSNQMSNLKPGDKIKLQSINFRNNSAVILPKSQPILYDLLCAMEENPNLKIEIQGHICCRLDGDVNNISTARARAIYNFLIRNKISRNRLSFKGYGTTTPIYPIPEKSSEEEEANRRVEILILGNK